MNRSFLFLSAFALILSACKNQPAGHPSPENIVPVRVEPASSSEFISPVRLSGILGTRQEMKLSFKTGGIIRQVNVSDGQSVKKGTVLVSLDLSEINAQVRQAEVAYGKAGRDLQRIENLYSDSVSTLEQVQNARSIHELAEAQKLIAEFNLRHSRIEAPSNGKVQKVLVETNEIIAPGYPAVLFASTDNDWVVRVAITDKDIVRLSLGDSAWIMMDAFQDDTLRAEITELGSIADPVTGTYEAELLIRNPDPEFRTGYIARAVIFPGEVEKAILVPLEALLEASDRSAFIYVVERGDPVKRRVILGKIMKGKAAVVSGIIEGDSVIVQGSPYIGKGTKVIPAK